MSFELMKEDHKSKVVDSSRGIVMKKIRGGPDGIFYELKVCDDTVEVHVINEVRDVKGEKLFWIIHKILYPDCFKGDKSAIEAITLESLDAYRVLGYKRSHRKIEVAIELSQDN